MTSVPKHVRIELTLPVRELAVLCCYNPGETNVQDIVTNALRYAALDCQDDETLWPDADLATLYLHKYIAGLRTNNMDINAKRVQDDLLVKSNVVDNALNAMRKKLLDNEPDTTSIVDAANSATTDSTIGADADIVRQGVALAQVREKVAQVMGSEAIYRWIIKIQRDEFDSGILVMNKKTLSLKVYLWGDWDTQLCVEVDRYTSPKCGGAADKPAPTEMYDRIQKRVEEILLQNIEEGIDYDQEEN